jgi:hypothetical protein
MSSRRSHSRSLSSRTPPPLVGHEGETLVDMAIWRLLQSETCLSDDATWKKEGRKVLEESKSMARTTLMGLVAVGKNADRN